MVDSHSGIAEHYCHTLLDSEALTLGYYNMTVYIDCAAGLPYT